jgi:hypothetical protein
MALTALIIMSGLVGCGLRQSKTGSLSSRIIDADGNAVMNAEVFSIFRESEKVYTAGDGGFYLSELPAGLNNIVVLHPDYALEERQIEIQANETTVIETIRLDRSNAPNKISNVAVIGVSSTTARLKWNTYRSVACNIDYGTTRSYGQIFREQRPATEHEVVLEGLSPETLYHFRVQYIDENAVSHYSFDYSFKTEDGYTPSPPLGISLLPIKAPGTVQIEWLPATASSVIGYNIYRSEKDQSWQLLNELPLSARTIDYIDFTARAGTFTRYAVVAVNEFIGESEKVISETVFVPGTVNENVSITWLDSPVILNSDLVIAASTMFTVEPGVEFRIGEKDMAGSGFDEQRVEIIVSGRLQLNGTTELPIRFVPFDGSMRRDHWAGIRILSSETGPARLSNVIMSGCSPFALNVEANRVELDTLSIAYSENAMRLSSIRESLNIDSMQFSNIQKQALIIESCRKITLSNSRFEDVAEGIVVSAGTTEDQLIVSNTDLKSTRVGVSGILGRSTIKNTLIVCSDGHGIKVSKALHASENYIDHCTIDAKNGIELASGSITIKNNIVVNRLSKGQVGINNTDVLTPSYEFNNIFGFAARYEGCGPGVGALRTDPLFLGGNPIDYRLRSDSPLNLQDEYGAELGRYGVSRL